MIVALAALLVCVPALAGPRSIADCEAIQAPDAYNQCLAAFGPTRGQRGKTYPGMASSGAARDAGRSHARQAPRFGSRLSYGRHGRVRMEFTPRAR